MEESLYKTCPRCGANLDPEERCECRSHPEQAENKRIEQEKRLIDSYYQAWYEN